MFTRARTDSGITKFRLLRVVTKDYICLMKCTILFFLLCLATTVMAQPVPDQNKPRPIQKLTLKFKENKPVPFFMAAAASVAVAGGVMVANNNRNYTSNSETDRVGAK